MIFPSVETNTEGYSIGKLFLVDGVNEEVASINTLLRDQRDDGQGASCDNISGASYSRTLVDGVYDFEVTAVAGDDKQSHTVILDNIQIDAPPTVQLDPLPVRVQAPTHLITWESSDAGGQAWRKTCRLCTGRKQAQVRWAIDKNQRPLPKITLTLSSGDVIIGHSGWVNFQIKWARNG